MRSFPGWLRLQNSGPVGCERFGDWQNGAVDSGLAKGSSFGVEVAVAGVETGRTGWWHGSNSWRLMREMMKKRRIEIRLGGWIGHSKWVRLKYYSSRLNDDDDGDGSDWWI